MTDISSMLENYDLKQVEEISNEYGLLFEWFYKEYPEGTIRLNVDNDKRYNILTYTLEVMTGKEATPNNVGFFQSKITITAERWKDVHWMSRFKNNIFQGYKDEINRKMNEHFWREREKAGH